MSTERIVDAAEIATWEAMPPSVYDDDGDNVSTPTGGTLYATWDAEAELYTLADGSGTTLTNEQMVALIAGSSTLETRIGYQKGPIEDLANQLLHRDR